MALKKKGAAEEAAPAPEKKAKEKKPVAKELTPAQKVAAEMAKNKKIPFSANVIFDPEGPLASATHWIRMPHPWAKLTGVEGIPLGHVTVIQGKPDSGKTTIAMHGMVEGQNQNYNVVLIDTEHKFNNKRLHDMDGDLENLLQIKCETIEDGFQAIEETLDSFKKVNKGVPTVFVWDSLGQTPTDEEMKGTSRSHTVASAAKVIKKNLRRLRSRLMRENAALVFINQVYDNINALFGNSSKGYGGNGAYYAAVLVIEVQRIRNKEKQIGGVKRVVGLLSAAKCTKNHLSDVQGAKVEMIIGPKGIEQDSVKDLEAEDLTSIADEDDDDDVGTFKAKGRAAALADAEDDEDLQPIKAPKKHKGREVSL